MMWAILNLIIMSLPALPQHWTPSFQMKILYGYTMKVILTYQGLSICSTLALVIEGGGPHPRILGSQHILLLSSHLLLCRARTSTENGQTLTLNESWTKKETVTYLTPREPSCTWPPWLAATEQKSTAHNELSFSLDKYYSCAIKRR
jgi:hypothetical protein